MFTMQDHLTTHRKCQPFQIAKTIITHAPYDKCTIKPLTETRPKIPSGGSTNNEMTK